MSEGQLRVPWLLLPLVKNDVTLCYEHRESGIGIGNSTWSSIMRQLIVHLSRFTIIINHPRIFQE